MRMRRVTLLAITVAVSALVLGSIAEAADNQAGTWKLNVAKSKYSPGPAPKDGTLTVESEPNGLKITIHGTDAEGKAVHMEFAPKYDGKDVPTTGMPGADTISMKKIDDYTVETVSKKGGKPSSPPGASSQRMARHARAPRKGRTPKARRLTTPSHTTSNKKTDSVTRQIIWRVPTWQRSFDAGK